MLKNFGNGEGKYALVYHSDNYFDWYKISKNLGKMLKKYPFFQCVCV